MPVNLYDDALDALDQSAPATPQTTYDEALAALDDQEQAQERRLRGSLRQAADTTPDRAATARRLSLRYGVPPQIIERNLEDWTKRDAVAQPYAQMQAQTPALATWLEDPANAAVAKDDLAQLGALEWLLTAPVRAWEQGQAQVRVGRLRAESIGRELTATERAQLEADKAAMRAGGELGATSWFAGAITGASRQLPNLLGALLTGARRGLPAGVTAGTAAALVGQAGPQVALPEEVVTVPAAFAAGFTAGTLTGGAEFTFQLEAGLAYDEYLDFKDELGQAIDPDVARGAALATGAINAGLEVGGLSAFLKSIPGVKQLTGLVSRQTVKQALRSATVRAALADAVKSYGGTLTAETSVEVAQRAATILSGELAKVASGQAIPIRTPTDVASDLAQEALGAIQSFALLVAPGPAMQIALDTRRAQRAAQHRTFFEALGEGASQSQTVKRMPQAAQVFLEQATKDGPISHLYVPVESWTTYWQERGVDPAEAANDVTGETESYDSAVRTGADLAIPTARYAVRVAPTEHHGFFVDELRLGPEEMNGREARAFQEQLAAQPAEAAPAEPTATERIRQIMTDRLVEAGTPATTAERYAELWAAAVGTTAERAGIDPYSLFQEYALQVRREAVMEGRAARAEPALPLEPAVPPTAPTPDQVARIGAAALELAGEQPVLPPEFTPVGAEPALAAPAAKLTSDQQALLTTRLRLAEDVAAARGETLTQAERADIRARVLEPVEPGAERAMAEAARRRVPPGEARVDTGATGEETISRDLRRAVQPGEGPHPRGALSFRRVEKSGARARESARQFQARREAHYNEVFASVLEAAKAVDPTVDVDRLRAEFDRHVSGLEDLHAEWHESGQNPRRVLEAIAEYGGISLEAEEGGYHGELRTLRESPAMGPFGEFAGVRGVWRKATRTTGGAFEKTGLSLDHMVESLRQDAEFQWIEDIDDLLKALDDAARWEEAGVGGGVLLGTDEIEAPGVIVPNEPWWMTPDERAAWEQAREREAITEFGQAEPARTEDVLPTGEVQPRLPGEVGAVRDLEVPTPTLEARFSLTPEVPGPEAKQQTLFQGGYHGSAQIFDRFSLHAIGSGEGAQAYGWGLYFASLREVADKYRQELAGAGTTKGLWYNDAPIYSTAGIATEETDPEIRFGLAELHTRAYWENPGPGAIERIRERLEKSDANLRREQAAGRTLSGDATRDAQDLRSIEMALAALDKYGDKLELRPAERPGRTYKVEIPEDPDFLDWDKPASQQSDKVQAALRALGVEWREVPVPSLEEALETFESPRLQQEAFEDIGVRESLREGYHYAREGNEVGFRRWFFDNQGLFTGRGVVDPIGENIYQELTLQTLPQRREQLGEAGGNVMAGAARLTSEALNAHGVAGIRYLDGFSRAGGQGTHNYVVFDDRLVQITEFYQPERRLPPGATIREGDAYQSDIFGEALRLPGGTVSIGVGGGEAGPVGDLQPAGVQPAAQPRLATRTQLVTTTTRQLGASSILTPEDAATATAYLARGAQERFDGIVTDAEGRPLAVVGAFKGAVDQTAVHPSIVLAEAFQVEGAAAIWFVHNHPSGTAAVSVTDEQLADRFGHLFRGTDIAMKGVLALAGGVGEARQFESYSPVTREKVSGTVRAPEAGAQVPVVEREFVESGKLAAPLANFQQAMQVVPTLAREQFGAVLVDAAIRPIGFVPMTPEAGAELRTEGRLDALYRAISVGNPTNVFIYAPDSTALTDQAALNLANAFHAVGIQVLDIVQRTTRGVISRRMEAAGIWHSTLTGQFRQERRGSIVFGPGREVKISLFERADLSTFLHESGHFFFELFGDLAERVGGLDPASLTAEQRQLLADYQTLLRWHGVENRGQITTEHHEKFASAFEAYLMEGKAPSLGLRAVFARFRAWLLGIYSSLRNLNVDLTDDVRQVFDRMLASEVAIRQAEAAGRVDPMFTTADEAGMSEAEFGLYRDHIARASQSARETLERKLLADVQREQEAQWKARREEIRSQVEQELSGQPVYRALFAMQRGTNPDGTPLSPLEAETGVKAEPLKLSRAILVERYGTERLKRLPRPYVYRVDDGLDPNVVAELFGFESGDGLLQAVESAQPLRRAVDHETERRMLAEHGSLLLDPALHDKAQAALANEDRELVVRAELRALAQLRRTAAPFVGAEQQRGVEALTAERRERTYERRWLEAEARLRIAIAEGRKQVEVDALRGEVQNLRQKARGGPATIRGAVPSFAVLREAARSQIARTRIRNLRPNDYWSASRRAAQRAIEAAARQDFEAAITAKQQELLTLALYREATRAQDEVEDRVRQARDLTKPAARRRIGQAGDSYLDQVDGILDRYEFARVSQRALDRRASLRKWVAALEGEGLPVDLPEELLEETQRVNYRELTVEAFIGITDGLRQIVHLARLKNRLLKRARQRELDAVVSEVGTSIRQHKQKGVAKRVRDRRPSEERARNVAAWFAGHRKLSSLIRELDGFEDAGPLWEYFLRPLNEAGDREAAMVQAATRRLGELVETAYPKAEKRRLYEKRHIQPIGRSLSKMEGLMIALNWGNEGNRDRIRRAEGWSDDQVQAILDTLDARDWQFVQGVWDFLESYWPQIAEKQERVVGVAPEKVEATPVTTSWGTFHGGYFPLKYDDRLSPSAAAHLDLETSKLQQQAAYVRATTRRGHVEARKQTVKLPVRLDFGVIVEHLQQVIHDLTHHEALIDVTRVLGHPEVQRAIYDTYGDLVYKELKDGVRDIAFGDLPATNTLERALNHVRVGTTVAFLGWNLTTAFMQPLGLTQSIVRVGPKWVAKGMGRWLRDAASMENTAHWITDRSSFMRTRFRTQQREIAEIRNRIVVHTGRVSGWMDGVLSKTTFDVVTRQSIADSFFWLIQVMQRVADIPTWLGGYEKAMAGGHDEATAIALADQAVLDSQAGGQTKDLARVQRGGPALKLWTNFYSFWSTTYNLGVESTKRTHFRHPAEVARLASDYLLLIIVPAVLSYAVREALKPGDADDDDAGWAWIIARESASYAMGTMLLLREAGGAVAGFLGYEGPAGARVFGSASRLIQQVSQGEADAAFWRSLSETAGMLFHFPTKQVQRSVEGFTAIAEGKTKNPLALMTGAPGAATKGRR